MPMQASKLRPIERFITSFNDNGKSVFADRPDSSPPITTLHGGVLSTFCYGTDTFPASFSDKKDLHTYERFIECPPGMIIPNGVSAKVIDFPPGCDSSMHRTVSLNFNVVVHGEMQVTLDSGEVREMKPGDMLVQRAPNHKWTNTSQTDWARITAFSLPAEPFEINGKSIASSGPY